MSLSIKVSNPIETETRLIKGLEFIEASPDGEHILCTVFYKIKIYNLKLNQQIGRDLVGRGTICSVIYSSDGNFIASGGYDKILNVWDTRQQTLICSLTQHKRQITSVAFSSDGLQIISGCQDGVIRIWSRLQQTLVTSFNGDPWSVNSVEYSHNSQCIMAVGLCSGLSIWNSKGTRRIKRLTRYLNEYQTVAKYQQEGQIIITGFVNKIRILDQQTRRLIRKHTINTRQNISNIKLCPNKRYILPILKQLELHIIDVCNGHQIFLEFGNANIRQATFSQDGRQILASTSDNLLHIRSFDPNSNC